MQNPRGCSRSIEKLHCTLLYPAVVSLPLEAPGAPIALQAIDAGIKRLYADYDMRGTWLHYISHHPVGLYGRQWAVKLEHQSPLEDFFHAIGSIVREEAGIRIRSSWEPHVSFSYYQDTVNPPRLPKVFTDGFVVRGIETAIDIRKPHTHHPRKPLRIAA